MEVPCPPIHFVADWMTMSAPCSIGFAMIGANVLSMISGSWSRCAVSAMAEMSGTSRRGFPIVSMK